MCDGNCSLRCVPVDAFVAQARIPLPLTQVGADLWSCPLFENELTNNLTNSATPNLTGTTREDNAIEFFAARDIAAGEALTIDFAKYGRA